MVLLHSSAQVGADPRSVDIAGEVRPLVVVHEDGAVGAGVELDEAGAGSEGVDEDAVQLKGGLLYLVPGVPHYLVGGGGDIRVPVPPVGRPAVGVAEGVAVVEHADGADLVGASPQLLEPEVALPVAPHHPVELGGDGGVATSRGAAGLEP
jgi:hypothetical protein